ncbi:hypothetical protein F2P81_004545 [Scophthalmus maximus]|uniref:Uncharacterized protein n=1 Tax=Scophthalmus maximus TaxID=52904 RepID=A0A6A4TFJ6_SCOMX|nr:hypothetical protein F2P81_004545 [Scophthalmus maximus]
MAMEDEDNAAAAAAAATDTPAGTTKAGSGACIDRQPDTAVRQAGLSQTAGPGARAATGIRVLKASGRSVTTRICVLCCMWGFFF